MSRHEDSRAAASRRSAWSLVSGVSRDRQDRRPAPPTSVRLYVFDGGTLESDPARYRLTKEDVGTTQLSVAAYLIVHPKGVLLWDTGAVPDEAWSPTGSPIQQRLVLPDGQERRVTIRTPLKAQLTASGYAARDVTHLALSHYHWDHTANANAFASATWLVRPNEREAMFAEKLPGTVTPKIYGALKNSQDDHRQPRTSTTSSAIARSSSRARLDTHRDIRCSTSSSPGPEASCCRAISITIRRSGR